MKQLISLGLCALITMEAGAAVRGDAAMYVGGTVKAIKPGTQGTVNLDSKQQMIFDTKDGSLAIQYADITGMEYGQKVGRRVGLTVALAATTMGLAALPILFSKKRKHYLTVNYSGEVVVLELAKDIVRTAIPIIEVRSGRKVEIQGKVDEANRTALLSTREPMHGRIVRLEKPEASGPIEEPIAVAVKPDPPKPARETLPGEFRPKIYGLN